MVDDELKVLRDQGAAGDRRFDHLGGELDQHQRADHHDRREGVLAVVSDLFFTVKLTEAAKRWGLALEFVKEPKDVIEKAQTKPSLIIFDLNFKSAQPLKLITKLKSKTETKGISLI